MKFLGMFFLVGVAILFGACYSLQQPDLPVQKTEKKQEVQVKAATMIPEAAVTPQINVLSRTGRGLDKTVSSVFESMFAGLNKN